MNDYNERKNGARNRGPFNFNLDSFFESGSDFWNTMETKIESTFNEVVKGVTLKKADGILTATLDVPGVAKDSVTVRFDELARGFTRLTITTKRDGAEKSVKSEFRERVEADKAKAAVKLGVLTITVPLQKDDVQSSTEVPIS